MQLLRVWLGGIPVAFPIIFLVFRFKWPKDEVNLPMVRTMLTLAAAWPLLLVLLLGGCS